MYFQELQSRLVDVARERVRAGQLTERGLARLCGMSQPHMHNVLKKIRALSNDSADRLMGALGLGVSDLLWRVSSEPDAGIQAIPVMRNRIGPGADAVFGVTKGYVPMPRSILKDLVDPVAARLRPDLVLPKALAAHDVVLLDRNPRLRAAPAPQGLWVVSDEGGMRVRYLRMGPGRLYIAHEVTLDDPERWQSIGLKGRNILDIVLARVVWVGRELDVLTPLTDENPAGQLPLPNSS
ncbi:MAG: hypothetical protein M3N93_05720 [Acidobacteriota bacterium]|nr:hypothetical protein [Acidobacteriota bacterium]